MGRVVLQDFKIHFEAGCGVVYAGQNIRGNIKVTVKEGMEIRAIKIRVFGKAATFWIEEYEWTDQTADIVKTDITNNSAEEVYVNLDQDIWTEKDGEEEEKGLAEGTHIFPFEFQIPKKAPTSIEAPHGYVRYLLLAGIQMPNSQNHMCKRAFTVIGLQDLNLDPNAKSPAQKRIGRSVGCWCFVAGDIVSQFSIARKGFVAGELIPIQGQISNSSSRSLKEVEITLYQHVLYRGKPEGSAGGKARMKREGRAVATMTRSEEIAPGEMQLWKGACEGVDAIRIPPVPPMMLSCQLIHIQYDLRVRIIPNGPFNCIEFTLPIIIGTIPLKAAIPELNRKYSIRPAQDGFTSRDSVPTLPVPEGKKSYPELPPPSFQSCVFGRKSIVDKGETSLMRGDKEFAPQYAYYDWDEKRAIPEDSEETSDS